MLPTPTYQGQLDKGQIPTNLPGSTLSSTSTTKYDANGQPYTIPNTSPSITQTTPPPSTSTTPTNISTPNSIITGIGTVDPNGNVTKSGTELQLEANQKAMNDAATNFSNTVTGIQNGVIPLSAGDQAQITGLQQQFQQLIDQQNLANTNASGVANIRGYQTGSAEYDPSFQAKTIGSVLSAGAMKIATLQTQEASSVAQLTQSLKDGDIKNIKVAYDALSSAQKDSQAAIQKTIDETTQAIKDAQDQQQKVTDGINNLVEELKKAGAPDSTIKAALNSGSVAGALQASGDYLQTSTDPTINRYLQYKKDAQANNLVPTDFATWKQKDDAQTLKEKSSEAYATAFATASGKAAADKKNTGPTVTSPVTSPSGIVYNTPASIAPYVSFAANGVKYVDMSAFKGTPTEANQAVNDAQAAGYKVITNKNTANDVQNITDASAKLADIKAAFDKANAGDATERNLYAAAMNTVAKKLQTDPNYAGIDVYQDAALDILKAMSGVQGFRGGASMVQQVKDTFPSITDTKVYADGKINNLQKLIDDRQTALVGNPSASDQALIDEKNNENNITTNINNLKTSNPSLYNAASSMFVATDPSTGLPYSPADILKAFPQLNQSQ